MTPQEFDQQIIPLGNKMYRLARALVGADGAEDVVQDVLERLWRGRTKITPTNVDAFVMRSVRNRCLDIINGAKLRAERAHDMAHTSPRSSPPQEEFDMVMLVEKFIAELPEKQQTILHLRDVEGYEFDTIAEVMEMECGTVRVNLSRARHYIKEQIKKSINYGLD